MFKTTSLTMTFYYCNLKKKLNQQENNADLLRSPGQNSVKYVDGNQSVTAALHRESSFCLVYS